MRPTPVPLLRPGAAVRTLIALQSVAGNHAVQRFLCVQRITEAQKKTLTSYRATLSSYQDAVAVLIAHEKQYNDEYFNTRVAIAQVGREDSATSLATLLEPLTESTPDETVKAALASAKEHAVKINKGLPNLIGQFGLDSVKQWVQELRTKRKEEDEVEQKKAAKAAEQKSFTDRKAKEQADALAAEQLKQATLSSLNVTPNSAGPAFAKPTNAPARANLLQWTHLTYPSFAGLTDEHLTKDQCLLYHLSADQLARVHTQLDGQKVTEWKVSGVPLTRGGGQLAGTSSMLMPVRVGSLPVGLGAEIFCDWVIPYTGHTAKITRIISSVNYVRTTNPIGVTRTVTPSNGKVRWEFNGGKYLIMSPNEDAVITYYDTF